MDGKRGEAFVSATTEIRRLVQRCETEVQARDESVPVTRVRSLGSSGYPGKIGGVRAPGYEHIVRPRVDGHGAAKIVTIAAEIGRLVERSEAGVQACNKSITEGAFRGLRPTDCTGKIERVR